MIIWIDGVLGIGKTTIAQELMERHLRNIGDFWDSDEHFSKMCNEVPGLACLSQISSDNIPFIQRFRTAIQKRLADSSSDLVITMALIRKESKDYLLNYFIEQHVPVLHIILTANKETIRSRIKSDVERDQTTALNILDDSVNFLEKNFQDAIWIDTSDKSKAEITELVCLIYQQFESN